MKNFTLILLLIGLFLILKSFQVSVGQTQGEITILTGFLLLGSYLFADIINKIKLPKLTGYMIVGIILGPMGFEIINETVTGKLEFLENLALSLIAITAGGEFRFNKFRSYKKSISFILIFQIIVVFFGTAIIFLLFAGYFPFLKELNRSILIGFAILFAGAAISTSPAVTIGIITELKSKGKITDIVLMVTVFKAIALVLLFPVIIISAKYFLVENQVLNFELFIEILLQLGSSIFTGVLLGILTIWYLKKIKVEKSIFLLGLTIVIIEVSSLWNMEILLTSIITGIIVRNFSEEGESLISGIELFSLPLYIIFFCFAGTSLHLDMVLDIIPITIVLVIARLILVYLGNYTGAALSGEEKNIKNYSWLGYTGQAGIALGLGILIERTFPGDIGQAVLTIMIATIVINEFIGPILFKYVLLKVKETNEDTVDRKKNYSRMRRSIL